MKIRRFSAMPLPIFASTPFACVITSPAPGANLTQGTPVTITGTISSGAVVVQVKLGATVLGSASIVGLTWSYSWTPLVGDVGTPTINAVATSPSAEVATAAGVTVNVAASGFAGDFGALFNANGLTVDGYWRGDLGKSVTGSIVNSWANQLGVMPSIVEGSAGVGVASVTTGPGRAAMAANGSTQYGTFLDNPQRPAPGTTNVHYYVVYRTITTPAAQQHLIGSGGFVQPIYFASNDQPNMYAGTPVATVSAAVNTWARLRASFTGAVAGTADKIKWGSAAEVGGFAGNNGGAANTHGLFATETGTAKVNAEIALLLMVRGPIANFLTQAALADTACGTWFTGVAV